MKIRDVEHHKKRAIEHLEQAKVAVLAEDVTEANRLVNLAQVQMGYMELAAAEEKE